MKRTKLFVTGIILLLFISCSNYGEKKDFGNMEIYYTSEIKEAQVDSVAKSLELLGFIDNKQTTIERSVKLDKVDSVFVLKIVANEDSLQKYEKEDSSLLYLKLAGSLISETAFNNKPVEVHLTDSYFDKTLKVIESYKKPAIKEEDK